MRTLTHRLTAPAAAALGAALAVAFAAVLALAGPAAAGGPTSVLLVNGGSGDAAALYATDPDYAALDKALGDTGEQIDPMLTEADLGGADARRITVTWLRHDVHVWRVDSLYPDARGGPVVARADGADATAETWQRVEHPERLGSLLDGLGVGERPKAQRGWYVPPQFGTAAPGELDPRSAADADAGTAPGTAAADGEPGTRERAAAGAGAGENWWWTLPGLAAGALLAVAAPRLRRRATAAGPRRVLLDRDERADRGD